VLRCSCGEGDRPQGTVCFRLWATQRARPPPVERRVRYPFPRGPARDQRLPVVRDTRSGNRASHSRAPNYEHPQWYPAVGLAAIENASEGGSSVNGCCAAVDWAKDEHAVCVLDGDAERVFEQRFAHEERGLVKLWHSLVGSGVRRVAIERPEGLLVERLLEAGLAVLSVHPNQLSERRGFERRRGDETGGRRVRQAEGGRFPQGLRQEVARRRSHARRRHPPQKSLDQRDLPEGEGSWLRPPARHSCPRSGLGAGDLAHVAR
jgi:hypothetical protein